MAFCIRFLMHNITSQIHSIDRSTLHYKEMQTEKNLSPILPASESDEETSDKRCNCLGVMKIFNAASEYSISNWSKKKNIKSKSTQNEPSSNVMNSLY